MGMMKLAFLAAVAFLSAIAIFMGVVFILTSLKLGSITLSYGTGTNAVTETISRASDASRYWRLITMMGLLPMIGGAAALWYSVRKLRGS